MVKRDLEVRAPDRVELDQAQGPRPPRTFDPDQVVGVLAPDGVDERLHADVPDVVDDAAGLPNAPDQAPAQRPSASTERDARLVERIEYHVVQMPIAVGQDLDEPQSRGRRTRLVSRELGVVVDHRHRARARDLHDLTIQLPQERRRPLEVERLSDLEADCVRVPQAGRRCDLCAYAFLDRPVEAPPLLKPPVDRDPIRHVRSAMGIHGVVTGARISEALNTTYGGVGQDVDGGPVLSFPKSKTEAGLRPIPLTPDAARMLTRRRAATGAGDDELIFPDAAGNPYDRRAWTRRVFKPAAKRAGVPWAGPHMLRHGVATLMAEQGTRRTTSRGCSATPTEVLSLSGPTCTRRCGPLTSSTTRCHARNARNASGPYVDLGSGGTWGHQMGHHTF
jgi:integrase